MKKLNFKLIPMILALSLLICTPVHAETGQSFSRFPTESENLTIVGRNMYEAVDKISATSLGLEESLSGMTDLYSRDGNIYILNGVKSSVLLLDKEYHLEKEIVILNQENEQVLFEGAGGIYIDDEKNIYICDTQNAAVLVADSEGKLLQTVTLPDADVIPEKFIFQPTSIVQDEDDNYYVVSSGSYYGALFFDSEFEFKGFYGANTVQNTVLDVFSNLWDMLTSTDAKRAKSARTLPYAFGDIAVDNEGYIYTCTGAASFHSNDNGKGQIQRLSPGGENTLLQRDNYGESSSSSSVNFLEDEVVATWEKYRVQNFSTIAINEDGFIFALDNTYGLVYVYDQDCNLITTFGGGVEQGKQLGLFQKAVSMVLNGDEVLVADSVQNTITVFRINDYGTMVQKAVNLYMAGDYLEAEPIWREIQSLDSNNIYAYRGLARVHYTNGDYKKALEYAEQSYDYVMYDMAFKQIRMELIEEYFTVVFLGIIVVVGAIVAVLLKLRKREEALIKDRKWRDFFNSQIHPFATFPEIKFHKTGSLKVAVIMIVLFVVTAIIKLTNSSFLFRTTDVYSYNSLYTLGSTAGLVVLWIISNWLVSTLMNGKGTLKDITICTGYSMLPLVVGNVLITILSYVLAYEDVTLINGISLVATLYAVILVCASNQATHEFSFGKFILSTIVTIFMMILIVFIIFMLVIMLQQFMNFLYTVYMEVAYR